MTVSDLGVTEKNGVSESVAMQLSGLYARIDASRSNAEARFEQFEVSSARRDVDSVMAEPSSSALRATLARIKATLKEQNEPDSPSAAAVVKSKETKLT